MKKIILSRLTKYVLPALLVGGSFIGAKAQTHADPSINILMQPPSIPLNQTAILEVTEGNVSTGIDDIIVANSVVITISVGGNAEITGIDTANSDQKWTVVSMGSGTNNSIRLVNNQTLESFDIQSIFVKVKGVVVMGQQTVTGNINYIPGANPLLGGRTSSSQGNADRNNDNSTTSLIVTPANPLPLHLISFTGQALNNKCATQLQWKTAEEKNFSYFAIQASADGRDFETIGKVNSNGQVMGSTYSYVANQPTGKGYYRLQMVDKDGTTAYSDVVSVATQCAAQLESWKVVPNPATSGASQYIQYVKAGSGESPIKVMVTDITGRKMWSADLNATPGTNVYQIPSGEWARGTYFVNLYDQNNGMINLTQKITLN